MNCPKCGCEQANDSSECPLCGIVFAKWYARSTAPRPGRGTVRAAGDNQEKESGLWAALLFHTPAEVNPIAWGARLFLLVVLTLWGIKFIISPINAEATLSSLWHLINLPFHEAGHIFFRPFGPVITSLGGSLTQLLMPAICLAVFLIKTRDPFAGAFSLWWMGQNFIDLAPYIDDARSLSMPLLGGNVGRHSPYGFHDWEFILRETGLIRFDHAIAHLSHGAGALLMTSAVAWGAILLAKQYGILRNRSRN